MTKSPAESNSIIPPGTDTSAGLHSTGPRCPLGPAASLDLRASDPSPGQDGCCHTGGHQVGRHWPAPWPAGEREGAGTAPFLGTLAGSCVYHFCSHPERGHVPHGILRPGKCLKSRQSSVLRRNGRTDIAGQLVLSLSHPVMALSTPRAPPGRASPQGALASSS